jgi:hypothetical protein
LANEINFLPLESATKASGGHGKNQSMVGHEIKPGNFRARTANLGFIGDMHMTK